MFRKLQDSNKQLEQTTGKLQEEKLRLDALLVRQYNLIAVLGKPRARGSARDPDGTGTGSLDSSNGDTHEGLTLGVWLSCAAQRGRSRMHAQMFS